MKVRALMESVWPVRWAMGSREGRVGEGLDS